jgi:hypothetical protein
MSRAPQTHSETWGQWGMMAFRAIKTVGDILRMFGAIKIHLDSSGSSGHPMASHQIVALSSPSSYCMGSTFYPHNFSMICFISIKWSLSISTLTLFCIITIFAHLRKTYLGISPFLILFQYLFFL